MFKTSLHKIIAAAAAAGTLCLAGFAGMPNASASSSAAQFKHSIMDAIHSVQGTDSTKVGVNIKVLKSGRVAFSSNGSAPMIPASNLKILTTATALSLMGPNYRLKTELRGAMPDASGHIKGNLYLKGGGDPTMVPPYCQPATMPYASFIRELRKSGVKVIDGDLVADDSIFDRQHIPDGWKSSYRLDAYSAPVGGLSLNGNLIEAVVSPSGCGLVPPCSTMSIVARYDNSGETSVQRDPGSNIVKVVGYEPGSEIRTQLCVEDPGLFAVGVFKKMLDKAGIKVAGKVRLIEQVGEPAEVGRLHLYGEHLSVPVSEIIHEINHESDNMFAEHLFRMAGQITDGKGTAASGMRACMNFMKSNRINTKNIYMADGCGLSPKDRISPQQLVSVLDAMDCSYYRTWFKHSLPHSGRGTLRGRLAGIEVRAKTGTLAEDSSLSGYVKTAAGQELAFSIIVNGAPVWSAVDVQNSIVQTMSAWDQQL